MAKKRILIDYDGTFAELPEAFNAFMLLSQSYDYECYIVTMRSQETDPIELPTETQELVKEVIYTNKAAKIDYCAGLGLEFAIYIEDRPIGLFCSYDTVGQLDASNNPDA